MVWLDTNEDGDQDTGEPGVSGVTVELFTAAGVSQGTDTTDANGLYLFENVPAGTYYLEFRDLPTGYSFTVQDAGSDDSLDSDAAPATGQTAPFTFSGTADDLTRDVGLVGQGIVLNFESSAGTWYFSPDTTVDVTITVVSSPEALEGFQLNFSDSDIQTGEFDLSNWRTGNGWTLPIDDVLDSPSDTFVSIASLSSPLAAPVELGTFQLTTSALPDGVDFSDLALTLNSSLVADFGTLFTVPNGIIPVSNYGDTLVHVVATPVTVQSVEINAGMMDPPDLAGGPQPASWQQQRSDIRTIQITFSENVSVAGNDLRFTNLGKDPLTSPPVDVPLTDTHISVADNVVTLTFAPFELDDGVYELEILPTVAGNRLDGNGDGTSGDSFVYSGDTTNKFHKLAADFNGSGGVNIQDFTTFKYWFGPVAAGKMPEYVDFNSSGGVNIQDFQTFKANFGPGNALKVPSASSLAAAFVASPTAETQTYAPITEEAIRETAQQALVRRVDSGLDADKASAFGDISLQVRDLGAKLGQTSSGIVVIDDDGAGAGWFVDATPWENRKFDSGGTASIGSPAWGRFDLLTVLMHEFGHVLGNEHVSGDERPEALMQETLQPGVRRVPSQLARIADGDGVDAYFADLSETVMPLLPFGI